MENAAMYRNEQERWEKFPAEPVELERQFIDPA
jgi:hypothetical protein